MKTCCGCFTEKSYFFFYKDSKSKDGHSYRCKDCKKQYDTEYKKTDNYKKKVRKSKWKEAKINITYEKYEEMLKEQEGKCGICGTVENQFGKGMCVDHCHETGTIRGLLCTECNLGLGHFKDQTKLLENAKQYLKKWTIV